MALELGMSIAEIKIALDKLQPVEHRLQLILAGGKTIIDDSFNGNLDGMLEAVNICSNFQGRRVIITPYWLNPPKKLTYNLPMPLMIPLIWLF